MTTAPNGVPDRSKEAVIGMIAGMRLAGWLESWSGVRHQRTTNPMHTSLQDCRDTRLDAPTASQNGGFTEPGGLTSGCGGEGGMCCVAWCYTPGEKCNTCWVLLLAGTLRNSVATVPMKHYRPRDLSSPWASLVVEQRLGKKSVPHFLYF